MNLQQNSPFLVTAVRRRYCIYSACSSLKSGLLNVVKSFISPIAISNNSFNFIFIGVLFIIAHNVSRLQEVANFGTNYFLLKIIFLAKRERELTTKFAISCNRCYTQVFLLLPLRWCCLAISANVPRLQEVANFGTHYFLLKI